MRSLALIALLPYALGQQYMLNLDCLSYPGPCNNDCYAIYSANKPLTLNYNADGKTVNSNRRYKAGCGSNSPCTKNKMDLPSPTENSCDEYPYASVVEGGTGAILRCTDPTENRNEGIDLSAFLSSTCGNQPCTFMLTFGNPAGGQTPFCANVGGTNDGFEYTWLGGSNYMKPPRDIEAIETGEWVLHEPDPADFFPPHYRREFLLEDGTRTLVGSRNLTASYDDAIFVSVRNGTAFQTRAVKELVGLEKSPEFQDPALRASKKAVEFSS